MAVGPKPEPLPSSYRLREHGALRLAIEVGSRTSLRQDVSPKLERYAEGLQPEEYLFYDADHRDLRLWRRTPEGYVSAALEPPGRVWSEAVDLVFAIRGDGRLSVLTPAGEPLLSHAEEATLRLEAETQASVEVSHRQEAERRAGAAEARMIELEAELARIREGRRE